MTRSELIKSIAATTSLSRKEAAEAVDAVFKTISRALKRGDEVRLQGFGTFTASKQTRSMGRNPRTGQPIEVLARSHAGFRPGKLLREGMRRGGDDDGHGGARRVRRK